MDGVSSGIPGILWNGRPHHYAEDPAAWWEIVERLGLVEKFRAEGKLPPRPASATRSRRVRAAFDPSADPEFAACRTLEDLGGLLERRERQRRPIARPSPIDRRDLEVALVRLCGSRLLSSSASRRFTRA